jgi:tetratricopeptide (TPR) repeat protein
LFRKAKQIQFPNAHFTFALLLSKAKILLTFLPMATPDTPATAPTSGTAAAAAAAPGTPAIVATKGILKDSSMSRKAPQDPQEGSSPVDPPSSQRNLQAAAEEGQEQGLEEWQLKKQKARSDAQQSFLESARLDEESDHKQHAYDIDGMDIQQLPWTPQETQTVLKQIQFLKTLEGDFKSIKKEQIRDMESRLKNSLQNNNNTLRRDTVLLEKIADKFRHANLVDMNKLSKLMERNAQAGQELEGKDVLLLCGETGSGKTTTLQFLAGTTFEEVEVDGFLHLQPVHWKDPKSTQFKTSYSREPTTRSLQALTVEASDGSELAICDVPAYDVANCIEEDVALGCAMVEALHKAKSVRIAVVLSHEGMGNRFSNLYSSLKVVKNLCAVLEKPDLKPFTYLFTHYDKKHKRLLHKQFSALARHPPRVDSAQQDLFQAFIEDIAYKTEFDAHVVLPCEEDPGLLLERLLRGTQPEQNAKLLFANFASDFSLKQLKLQMEIQLQDFHTLLLQEEYGTAMTAIHRMTVLSESFSQMEPFVQQALGSFKQQVAQLWVLVVRSIGKQDYYTAFYRMSQLKIMAGEFPDAVECSQLGQDLLTQGLSECIAGDFYGKAINQLILMSKLMDRFPDAQEILQFGLEKLKEKLQKLLNTGFYDTAVDIIQQLGRVDQDIEGAFTLAQHGLHMAREILLKTIDDENYTAGMHLMVQISGLGEDFAEADACVRRALKTIRKRIDRSVEYGDYVKAGYLLRNLSKLAESLRDGGDSIELALDAAAQHACELRMEVVNAFEALLKCKEQKRFTQLLDFTANCMSTLAKSEPMRVVCAEYYQSDSYPKDDNDIKPNYLAILCTPKDCTSEAFCTAQVKHLLDIIAVELPEIEGENASIENLMTDRKPLLSVVARLRAANIAFKDFPGGRAAHATYMEVFAKFQALIENILMVSETSFQSSMEMKEFEIQAWFLAFLIQGFAKGRADDSSEDSKLVDELDHRRVKLMLRFENEVSDTMELLGNYNFLDFQDEIRGKRPDFPTFFEENKMSELEAPRQLLLSLSEAPQLCKMLATQVDTAEAKEPVVVLDKSVVKLFTDIVAYLETEYERMLSELKSDSMSYTFGIRYGQRLLQDMILIRTEFAPVQLWSAETQKGLRPNFYRLDIIEATLQELVKKLKVRIMETDEISPMAFITNAFGCTGPCFCEPDDFVERLPKLPPARNPEMLITQYDTPEFNNEVDEDDDVVVGRRPCSKDTATPTQIAEREAATAVLHANNDDEPTSDSDGSSDQSRESDKTS